ncbi:FAD-dependent monooxygenase [Rhodopirellula sallentina]|uniref:Monooxygenase, FAD-binding protein n=1 Tax=Rhodopirellula sallentina SM41 TaxID=1263870 RepID=M5TTX7_9BACT|nr:FAD-dependent monooxygenase [Rhodopirellula sallentina]EMI52642.1 monooxygenase, FAD-binding protein [Rhodopirellula sallentina SM41]
MEVAILGAGIAGLASAITLHQIGISVRVFERRESVHNLGAGVVCWPNATFVLSQIGILDELCTVAGNVTAMRRTTQNEVELGTLNVQQIDAAMGFPSLAVLREDLMRVLLQRAEECGILIAFNTHATAIERTGDHCRVLFADGTSISPTLIIGADGRMDSKARQYTTKDNRPVYQGFVNWIGIHRWDQPKFDPLEIRDYWGVGARFGVVPVSAYTAYWAGGLAVPERSLYRSRTNLSQLRQTFDGWPAPVSEIVRTATNTTIKCLGLFDHDPVPKWHRDNVLMIGDAAHAALPTSGQGAAQAFEDAWFLAREFSASPGDLENAMARFTQQRLEKTSRIAMGGRMFASSLYNTDAAECASRDRNAIETDYAAMALGMASAWSDGLPIG